ncbi:hypothetical protein HaLaN_19633, partial [Haematococcus lacustris]
MTLEAARAASRAAASLTLGLSGSGACSCQIIRLVAPSPCHDFQNRVPGTSSKLPFDVAVNEAVCSFVCTVRPRTVLMVRVAPDTLARYHAAPLANKPAVASLSIFGKVSVPVSLVVAVCSAAVIAAVVAGAVCGTHGCSARSNQ